MTKPKSLSRDPNVSAFRTMQIATGQAPNPAHAAPPKKASAEHMRAIASKGGQAGGKALAEATTPATRSEIAKKAAQARWAKTSSDASQAPESAQSALLRGAACSSPSSVLPACRDLGAAVLRSEQIVQSLVRTPTPVF